MEEDLEGGSKPAEEQRRPPAETPDAFKDFLDGLDLVVAARLGLLGGTAEAAESEGKPEEAPG